MKIQKIKTGLLTAALIGAITLTGYAAVYEWPNVGMTEETQTVLYGAKKDEAVYFNSADLEFKLGVPEGELVGITVLSLPKEEEGKLTLDGTEVKKYDRVSRTDINNLAFVPAKNSAKAEFSLLPESADSVKTTLSINLYDKDNQAPALESGKFSTAKNMKLQGNLSVYDPDGDQIMIKVLTKPQKGDIQFSGANFTYEPFYDMTGLDQMTVACVDKQGNYSKKCTLTIDIEKDKSSFSYADMTTNPSHYSAVKLNEKGVLTGEKAGDAMFFHPDRQVTRGDFLKNLIAVKGLDQSLPPCVNTGLQNDSDIPLYLKPYVKRAVDKKIITEKQFKPDQVLTRAEAVVLLNRAAGMENVKKAALSYADKADIPAWALQSYMNLDAYKMLDFYDGRMQPTAALKNDHMADLLWQLWKYEDANRK